MKKITIVLLFSVYCSAQNAYRDAKLLTTPKVAVILSQIKKLQADDLYSTRSYKMEVDNLKSFLDNPFSEAAFVIDIPQSLETLNRAEAYLASTVTAAGGHADTDGDGISDSKDKCPDKAGRFADKGCPPEPMTDLPLKGQDMTTVLVDALAKFLVDRVKQELTISFYENFKTKLDKVITVQLKNVKDSVGKPVMLTLELKKLFPNTYLMLSSKKYFDTPSLGKTWVTAFKKDLITLPEQLEIIVRSSLTSTNVGKFAIISFDAISYAKKGMHPIAIIEKLGSNRILIKDYSFESSQVLGLLSLISSNLTFEKVNGSTQIKEWASVNDLKSLDTSSKKYLTALIYQQGVQRKLFEKIQKAGGESLKSKISINNYLIFYDHIEHMSAEFSNVIELLKEVRDEADKKDSGKTLEDYSSYLNSFFKLFDINMESIYILLDDPGYYESSYYKKIKPIVQDVIGFNNALGQKNYAECILLSTDFLQHVFSEEVTVDANSDEALKEYFYYCNFLADIIAASESDNSENVKKIIENYAMPVNSYRIKRYYSHSWDVNAFPGIYGGYEFDASESFAYGITAPVGISYSRRLCLKKESSGSVSFFLSVIDIGAPFSYRFTNDEAQGLPEEIKWEQIFSPGLFIIFGVNNSPISFSISGQFTPLLRDIKDESNIVNENNIFRLSAGILVDIPLFNLKKGNMYNKTSD
ncbi:hypothetical protein [Flavobacterium sp. FlaQc-30]|uniref:hypothetical protein n=1 Tax=Flavobacterium sp. FlaQc-30 TaxID=3374179 RepID=UPI0037582C93